MTYDTRFKDVTWRKFKDMTYDTNGLNIRHMAHTLKIRHMAHSLKVQYMAHSLHTQHVARGVKI